MPGAINLSRYQSENILWVSGPLTIKYLSYGAPAAPNIYFTVRTDGKFW